MLPSSRRCGRRVFENRDHFPTFPAASIDGYAGTVGTRCRVSHATIRRHGRRRFQPRAKRVLTPFLSADSSPPRPSMDTRVPWERVVGYRMRPFDATGVADSSLAQKRVLTPFLYDPFSLSQPGR